MLGARDIAVHSLLLSTDSVVTDRKYCIRYLCPFDMFFSAYNSSHTNLWLTGTLPDLDKAVWLSALLASNLRFSGTLPKLAPAPAPTPARRSASSGNHTVAPFVVESGICTVGYAASLGTWCAASPGYPNKTSNWGSDWACSIRITSAGYITASDFTTVGKPECLIPGLKLTRNNCLGANTADNFNVDEVAYSGTTGPFNMHVSNSSLIGWNPLYRQAGAQGRIFRVCWSETLVPPIATVSLSR